MKNILLEKLIHTRNDVILFQTELTKRPAIGPSEGGIGEFEKAQWIEETVRSWGITDIQHFDISDDRVPNKIRPNLVIRYKGKTDKTLWIIGHMDVVPPGDMSLWKTNPFEACLDDFDPDIIRGRGVEDNQQAIVSGLLILQELIKNKITPDLSLALLFVADEETRNTYGINHVIDNNPNLIKKDDLVLVPDFGTTEGNLIEIAEKGVLWLAVEIEGKQCHGSTPDEGNNALIAASDMILQLHEVEKAFPLRNKLFIPDRTTITPTRHEENVPNINTISGKERFYIDCRVLPDYKTSEVINKVTELGNNIAQKYHVTVSVSVNNLEESSPYTDQNAPVVLKLKQAIKNIYHHDCICGGVGGATVGCKIRSLGIPVAVWSSVIPNYHQPNEGSKISHAINDARVFAQLLFEE